MAEYDASTYGDRHADVYDEMHPNPGNVAPGDTAAALAKLAGDGPVLELGIGTGRIALPLTATGVDVHGIDASQAMVDKMLAKPGGADIPVTIGDFSSFALDRQFSLVYVVFNTLFNLRTQDDQVRCFESVAEHLQPGGRFVIEAFVPDVGRYERGQCVSAMEVELRSRKA